MNDRIPPQDLQIERAVLGSCLFSKETVEIVCEKCSSDDFYSVANKEIFKAIYKLNNNQENVDMIILDQEIKKSGIPESVVNDVYIAELSENLVATKNIEGYIKILRNKAILRALITESMKIQAAAFAPDAEAFQIISTTEQSILEMSNTKQSSVFYTPNQILPTVFENLEKLARGEMGGLSSGFKDLDLTTGGFTPGDLIILAARPSQGKTSLAMQFAENAAIRQNSVAVFSIEMNKESLIQRMLSSKAEINLLKMRSTGTSKQELERIMLSANIISEYQIFVDDIGEITPSDILSKSRRLKVQSGLDLIIIDHLSLMESGNRSDNRNAEVSHITRSLKKTAKALNVPIILLSQLSRNCESRTDKRPQLSDLRDSGSIEQDADLVMFIYRDEVYNSSPENQGKAEIIIAKQRNGPIGTINMQFKKWCAKFEDQETYQEQNENNF